MRFSIGVASAILAASAASADMVESSAGPLSVTEVARGFEHPWAMAFLPDGRLLVTERPGSMRLVADGVLSAPISGVPEVFDSGQGGLLDLALAHDFAESGLLFFSYAEPTQDGARTAVARARLEGDGLEDVVVIFRQSPARRGGRHFGSRIVVAPDGNLFVTLGDRGDADQAQEMDGTIGKIVRIAADGSIPPGNPFIDTAHPEIWSIGHRNPQGAALDGEGRFWTVSHGARGGDEINRPEAGRNYGWPVITYGRAYSGQPIGEGVAKEGMEQPLFYWDPSIAPSGMAIYQGDLFPEWRGDAFIGALRAQLLSRVAFEDGEPSGVEERLFDGEYGRIRDVREGPDGAIWFLTDDDPGAIYRIAPAG